MTGSRNFELVERELVDPLPGQVRLRVEACGVCRTDFMTIEERGRPDPSIPMVPGHEIVGVIDAVGAGVRAWRVGERVGLGFKGGHCGECDFCRRGDFVNCTDQPTTGFDVDGGYAEVVYARASGLVRIPDGLGPIEAAPLICAGLTVYNALMQIHSRPGELVAVQGIGGLGHLAVQYANKLGYRVAAIARGAEKGDLAKQLGAEFYIDSASEDPGVALQKLGGASAIIATAASGSAMSPLIPGLAPRGVLVVVGAAFDDPITVHTGDLFFASRRMIGSLTGTSIENEDSIAFSRRNGVHSMNEVWPFTDAPGAYEHMIAGKARFRVVLDMAA